MKVQGDKYQVLGVMSGTSLDGMDLALCEFEKTEHWTFRIVDGATIPYDDQMANRLQKAHMLDGAALTRLHLDLGALTAANCISFLESRAKPDAISMHGHTVFHEPKQGLTLQIGSLNEVAARTGITTIGDFRSLDVALGGQGAPLVPIGDRLLFGDYDACLNLGGFANVSMEDTAARVAWDVCPVNFVLNRLAQEFGLPFDRDGNIAKGGKVDEELLGRLESISFYQMSAPKSLGREWFEQEFWAMMDDTTSLQDRMRTAVEHIALRITNDLNGKATTVLATGGGVLNQFLIERVGAMGDFELIIPEREIVELKEALIFAFLGVLRLRGEVNVLSSVTGALRDQCAGVLCLGE